MGHRNIWRGKGSDVQLEEKFTEEEIKEVLWGLAPNKAPGPNGFSIMFYKRFWRFVKGDLIKLTEEVYTGIT